MTDENSEDDEFEEDDDGITIEVTDNVEDTSGSEDAETNSTNHETTNHNEDFLDEDGTVALDSDEYEGSIRLVGTVHVSKDTRERVVDTVNEERPSVVAIELDRDRLYEMFERGADVVGGDTEEEEQGGGLRDILRQQQEGQFSGEELLQPGEADMLPAVREGVDTGSRVALIDMSMDQLGDQVKDNAYDEDGNLDLEVFNKSFGEIANGVKSFVRSRQDMSETLQEEGMGGVVKEMEEASLDEVREQMDPLREIAPEVVEALIDERDQYMAGHLHWLRQNGHDVVATMGRGHLQGVYSYLQNPETIPEQYVSRPDWYDYQTVEIN